MCERALTEVVTIIIITTVITNMGVDMFTLKLTQIGNSVGVVLPREALAKLKVAKGESVFLTETPNGYVLTPYDPSLDEEIQAGRAFMHEFRDTFHQLAK